MTTRRFCRDGAAFLGFTALAVIFTYPLVFQLSSRVWGSGDDPWIFLWNNWWTKQILVSGKSPYWTSYLYFPRGASLVYHSFSWTNSVPAVIAEPLVGPLAAYNLVLLAGYAFTGWATYLLVSYLTGKTGPALVAGIVFAFSPYRIAQASHPLFVTAGWIPLSLLFLIRCTRERRVRDAIAAGLFLALTGLTAWHLLIFAGMGIAILLVYTIVRDRRHLTGRTLGLLALAAVVALALLMPALYPLLRVQSSGQADEEIYADQADRAQTDLLAFLVPNRLQPIHGHLFTSFYDRFQKNRNYVAFLGFSVVALAALGAWRERREATPWVLLAGFYGLMALGPVLRFNGRLFPGVPMPYSLIGWTPFVRLLKQPDRFNLVVGLPIAVLAGLGVSALEGLWETRLRQSWQWLVPAVCGLVIAWEYLSVPVWTISAEYPPFLDSLRSDREMYGILDLPMGRVPDKRYLFYQTIHQKPIVGGHISRPLPGTYDFIEDLPLLAQLASGLPADLGGDAVTEGVNALASSGVRYIVLHKGRAPGDVEASWRRLFEPWWVHEDPMVLVYETTRTGGARSQLDDAGVVPMAPPHPAVLGVTCWRQTNAG